MPELKNSRRAAHRPRQPGGFFVPIVLRGRRGGPGLRPKARRPVLARVLNPRGTVRLRTDFAPVTAAQGATGMSKHHPSGGNGRPFPASPPSDPPTVRDILSDAPHPDMPSEALDTAWNLVCETSARDGGEILCLALAIGCLCRALDAPQARKV